MNIPAPPSGLHPEDYDRIEAAVMETVRGRWFLLEYARRQRAVETERLATAIDRLERYVASQASAFEASAEPRAASDDRRAGDMADKARDLARALREAGRDRNLCARAEALADDIAAFTDSPKNAGDAAILAAPPAVAAARAPEILGPEEASAVDPRLAALSRLDHLSLHEKLVLFG